MASSDVGDAHYKLCPECAKAERLRAQSRWLHEAGVPKNMLHATFENFEPYDAADCEHLEAARTFRKSSSTFLVLLGNLGTGKTHLAVAAMRDFCRPHFARQSALMYRLRATYRDRSADSPLEACERADLLVLDEVGIGVGGRDELPLVREILQCRDGEQRQTILTGNITREELKQVLGPRLVDRFKVSAQALRIFGGPSRRATQVCLP